MMPSLPDSLSVSQRTFLEAADALGAWRYCVYRARNLPAAPLTPAKTAWTPGRFLKTVLFWLIVLLIPIALIQLSGRR